MAWVTHLCGASLCSGYWTRTCAERHRLRSVLYRKSLLCDSDKRKRGSTYNTQADIFNSFVGIAREAYPGTKC